MEATVSPAEEGRAESALTAAMPEPAMLPKDQGENLCH